VMVPVLAVMYLEERRRVSLDAMWLAVSPAGAAAYAAFLWLRFGSPLMWFTAERGWRRQIGMSSLTGFVDGFKTMLLGSAHDVRVHVYDHVVFVAFALAALALLLHRHWALGALSLLALVVPAASGELSSMNRYAIAAFGVFAWVGWKLERRPASVVVLCSMCFVMLVWITSWFIGGAFVG